MVWNRKPATAAAVRASALLAKKLPETRASVKPFLPRNFQIFTPLDFLAEVTQHIPRKGEHQIRYYGWYSNKKRGLRQKKEKDASETALKEKKKACMKWAQLIKLVYEVYPLICPKCGGTMKIVSFIEQKEIVRRILKHLF